MPINSEQKNCLLAYLKNFLKNPIIINEGIEEDYPIFDQKRISAIPILRQLVEDYLKN